MKKITISLSLLVAITALIAGCGGSGEPSSGESKGGPYLRCAPPLDDEILEKIKLPPLLLKRNGYQLDVEGLKRGVVILGVLAGIQEPTNRTLENLRLFLEKFKTAEVQAIVIVGGVGLDELPVSKTLETLAQAPVPILVTPGAQESFDIFRKVIAKEHKKHPQLIDMTLVRRVKIGHVNLVSLPGYHNSFYLEAKERGCSYEEGDLADVLELAEEKRVNVLISPSPPLGSGVNAVDMGRGNVNIGDPLLAKMLKKSNFSFGLFGHVYESGGQATKADGFTPVLHGVWQNSLYLQAGAADSIPISLVNGGMTAGMGHIVELSGNRARYRSVFSQR